jgi:hypothetical protein
METLNTIERANGILQKLLDAETVNDIVSNLKFSSTGKHISKEHNAVALALLQELQKRIAMTANPDEQLSIARDARAAWHKVIRQALNVASDGLPVSHSIVLEQDSK